MQPEVNIPKITHENKELSENPLLLYEVIRIIEGIPLFLEDHLERLYNSANLSGMDNLPDQKEIEKRIVNLIAIKNRKIGNIKLTFTISVLHQLPKSELDFIPHFYPPDEKYISGVKLGLLETERPNPQVKAEHLSIRNKANLIMSKENVFEVLLVDHFGNITEGSRSNVFFVKNNQLYTSPDEKVLNGITRRKILKLCITNNIPVIKKDIPLIDLGQFEGAFLTGSSPKVLPVSAINNIHYKPDLQIIRQVIELYDIEIDRYIKEKLKLL
jgi:branched-chain amino acid aminotransferase